MTSERSDVYRKKIVVRRLYNPWGLNIYRDCRFSINILSFQDIFLIRLRNLSANFLKGIPKKTCTPILRIVGYAIYCQYLEYFSADPKIKIPCLN
jgi:hypothetical protein